MDIELLIQHDNKIYQPIVEEGITWATERKNVPGQLTFKVVKDDIIDFQEGDPVRLKVDGTGVFYGFVFKKKRDKDRIISVTAYDQLRYLKNKDTYVYTNKTASEFIKMLAKDFKLSLGAIEDTGFKIASRVDKDKTLFDMIGSALDMTMQNKKMMYVLYDDFGKLTLKSLDNMRLNLLIDNETAENFDYTTSIDDNTYNKVVLKYENKDTGKRDVYIAQSGDNINKWGVLQMTDSLKDGENGQAKADALLSLYNSKTRNLSIKNAIGDIRVRAGAMVTVMMGVGDINIKNLMLVEKCKHEFYESQHLMTLTLRGGEFIA